MNSIDTLDFFTEMSLEALWKIKVKESIDQSIFNKAPDPSTLPLPKSLNS